MPIRSELILNPQQKEAVEYFEGPLLVLAGAGSGKTGVLTHKIAHLIENKMVSSHEILAVTFTNKAANEMKSRVEALICSEIFGMWIGTFHSICARILRSEAESIGYNRNFTIYDTEDQYRLIQKIMEYIEIDSQVLKARTVQYNISNNKNKLHGVKEYEKSVSDITGKKILEIFKEYEGSLKRNNAFDFDDLLIKPLEIFTIYPEILNKYQKRFRYILVDEYQDTNRAQYHLIKMLSDKHRKICVVGDEDQSIYRWRGADIENILSFESDFPECKVVRLEQNYRSSQTILDAANSLVSHNKKRLGKNLWSMKNLGEKICIYATTDQTNEASYVVEILRKLQNDFTFSWNDVVILYRTNAQSRALEDGLRRAAIPYNLVGGVKFYERKEVKDILSYLRVLVNPNDSNSLRRIINTPSRGIGQTSLLRLEEFSLKNKKSLFDTIADVEEIPQLTTAVKGKIKKFYEQLEKLQKRLSNYSAFQIVQEVIESFNLRGQYLNSEVPEDQNRLENINELLNSISIFVDVNQNSLGSLEEYLQEVSLLTDIDQWDEESQATTLMTLHSAKGLEFPVVIITGLEDGLLPIARSIESADDLEEERRLFYVGMTRAKEQLHLTWAKQRHRFQSYDYGVSYQNMPSRFLKEIPGEFKTEMVNKFEAEYHRRRLIGPSSHKHRKSKSDPIFPVLEESGYSVGQLVYHDVFGKGQILGIESGTNGTKLTILFTKNQIKKLIAEYANLQTVD